MLSFPRLAAAAVIAGALAQPTHAQTDPQPSLLDFFSLNRIGTFFANTAIAALRTQMEVEYEFLSTDVMRGTVSISGVTVRPLLPYDQARQCVITIERVTLNTDVARPFEIASEMNLNMIGGQANTACVPRDVAMGLRAAGMRQIDIDEFKIRAAYTYTTGETSAEAVISVNEFASLDVAASGMILPRMGAFGPGDPAIRFTRAIASLKDRGGWAKVAQVLPANFADPQTIKAIGSESVTQFLSDNGLRPITAVERNFVAQLMDRVEEFVTDPGEITIEAQLPPTGIIVEPEVLDTGPQELIAALALEARTSPRARSEILDTAALAGLNDPASLSTADRLKLAAALVDGIGVPQVPALVPELLEPLMEDPEVRPEASALIAQALQDMAPQEAYRFALMAAAAGSLNAVSLLDRLEAQISTNDVMILQEEMRVETGPLMPEDDDPRSLRRLALAYLSGNGAGRSYADAYYYALLATAAGDIGATALKKEIEDRFEGRGQEVARNWQELRDGVQLQALEDWIEEDMATRYKTR